MDVQLTLVIPAHLHAQAEAPGQRLDGGGVAVRLAAAQPVVDMGELEVDAEKLPAREQQVRQTGRVGAAGDGDDDPRARRDEPVTRNEEQEVREQGWHRHIFPDGTPLTEGWRGGKNSIGGPQGARRRSAAAGPRSPHAN